MEINQVMKEKFCQKCGASVPENANFCSSCGTNLSTITAPLITAPPTTIITEYSSTAMPKAVAINDITNLEISTARMKSYNGTAVLVFFLYLLLYFPGLIVNYIYYQEAKKMEEKAGTSLPGVGLLAAMLWINAAIIVLSILITGFLMVLMVYFSS